MKNKSVTLLLIFFNLCATAQSFNSSTLFQKSKSGIFEITTYDNENTPLSYGTGFFIDSNGVGVTNYHVLKDAFHAIIKTSDKKTYLIKDILFADEDFDIVKFTVENSGKKFKYLKLSQSNTKSGEDVFVIGNPEGLDYSISNGIIAAIRNENKNGKNIKLIQTTAPISHGNSGSPLINKQGKVIGIISFTYSEGQNLNFAISLNDVINNVSIGLVLPLDKNARSLKVDQYEQELIKNNGSFKPKDKYGDFLGLDREVIKSFYRDWQIVQNTDFLLGLYNKDLGLYNYSFHEKSNICDGVSYDVKPGEEINYLINGLIEAGYRRPEREVTNGATTYFNNYYIVTILPEIDGTKNNLVMVNWNPNFHPNHKTREYK